MQIREENGCSGVLGQKSDKWAEIQNDSIKRTSRTSDCANVSQLPNVQEGYFSSEDSHSNPTRKDNIENKRAGASKTANQTKCDICQKLFKSTDNFQTHDEKFHMKIFAN